MKSLGICLLLIAVDLGGIYRCLFQMTSKAILAVLNVGHEKGRNRPNFFNKVKIEHV